MAQHFESEAVVVIDGEEIPVHARLTVMADAVPKSWGGVLDSGEPALTFKLINGRRSVLRMPDGKEAPIAPGRDVGGGASFVGSGRPPI